MRAKTKLGAAVWATVRAQDGVISRRQLTELGVGRRVQARLAGEGVVSVVTPGVLSFGSTPAWLGCAWAGLLVGGPDAVLGLEAAGHLHGLVKVEPEEIAVFVGRERWPSARPGYQFIRSPRRAGHAEPARTTVEVTLIDLCESADEDGIAAMLADALSSHRTTATTLLVELSGRSRHRQRTLIRDILGDVTRGANSALERRFLTGVERAHGLPEALRQAHAHSTYRCDCWYREYGVIVELDSRLHHTGGAAYRDLTRDNEHMLQGIVTLRLGWGHVTGTMQCETAVMLGQLLMSRGWEGTAVSCARCRLVHDV